MPDGLRPFLWPLTVMLLAVVLWVARPPSHAADFGTYHTAATHVLAGDSPYATDATRPFVLLPIVALVLTPLGFFDLEAARALWFTVSAGLLTAFVRWSIHGLPERRRSDETLQWIVLLVLGPVFAHELAAGALTIVAGALMVAALLAGQVDLPRVGGGLVAVAILIEPRMALLLPWLVAAHGRPAAVATTTVLGVALLAPALLYGWTGNVRLLAEWFAAIGVSWTGLGAMVHAASASALWVWWIGAPRPVIFFGLLTAVALLALLASVWSVRTRVSEPDYLDVALGLALVALLSPSPALWSLVLATPAIVCILDRWADVSSGWRIVCGVSIALLAGGSGVLLWPSIGAGTALAGLVSTAAVALALSAAMLRRKLLA